MLHEEPDNFPILFGLIQIESKKVAGDDFVRARFANGDECSFQQSAISRGVCATGFDN